MSNIKEFEPKTTYLTSKVDLTKTATALSEIGVYLKRLYASFDDIYLDVCNIQKEFSSTQWNDTVNNINNLNEKYKILITDFLSDLVNDIDNISEETLKRDASYSNQIENYNTSIQNLNNTISSLSGNGGV